jgi:hypothetical protein
MDDLLDHAAAARAYAVRWAELARLLEENADLLTVPLDKVTAEPESPKAYAMRFISLARAGEVDKAAGMLLASWEAAPIMHGEVTDWLQWRLTREMQPGPDGVEPARSPESFDPGAAPASQTRPTVEPDSPPEQYVTLDQAAALVNRSKKTLERLLRQPRSEATRMPDPDVVGTGGRPHEWRWGRLRPWLETAFGKSLPPALPSRSTRPTSRQTLTDTDTHPAASSPPSGRFARGTRHTAPEDARA